MASTSISKLGGVVVVTQVIPQDENAVPFQDTTATTIATTQAPPPVTMAPPTVPSPPIKIADMTSSFLQGEPQGLGLVQILIGLLAVLFSLTAIFSSFLIAHAPFALAAAFVVSGSLAVKARSNTSVVLVRASLVSNLLSALLSVAGVAYLCWLLADENPAWRFCSDNDSVLIEISNEAVNTCVSNMRLMNVVLFGLHGLLLVLLVLQVCVSISVCVFAGKALRLADRYAPIMVMVDDTDVALLGSEGGEMSKSNSP